MVWVVDRSSTLYFRPESSEAALVRTAGERGAFDAGIIRAKYLADYPKGHPLEGDDPSELARAFRERRIAYVVDLDTPALCRSELRDEAIERRLRSTAAARALDLPLAPDELNDTAKRTFFVGENIAMQAGAQALAAPYLEVMSEQDVRLQLNAAMVADVVAAGDGRPVVAFVQVTRHRLESGLLRRLAAHYAGIGLSSVVLRVRDLDAEEATTIQLRNYLEAVDAFAAHDLHVIVDCVGRLGPVLVARGARGFSTGARFFRKVAQSPINTGGGGGGGDLLFEVPGRLRGVAVGLRRTSGIPRCAVGECATAGNSPTNAQLREHNLHSLKALGQLAAALGPAGFAAYLLDGGDDREREWARVLLEQVERAA